MQLRDILVHLNLIEGIGPAAVQRLLHSYGTDLSVLYTERETDFVARGLSYATAQALVTGLADRATVQRECELIQKYGIEIVVLNDEEYPSYLREIHYPPPVLYVRGVLPTDSTRMVAMVGSRDANAYGVAVVDLFAGALVDQAYVMVSGGARGIDIQVHRIALKKHTPTVVVLGSGLLRPYPREHTHIFAEVVEAGGAVISPFPLMTPPVKGNFPARNRIIAGCAQYCIVVQAAAKSGALITASYALQEGREVGVVPGSIFDPISQGCHALLGEGATLLSSVETLYQFVGCTAVGKVSCETEKPVTSTVPEQITLLCAQPQTMDELLHKTGMTAELLYDRLWDLQIKGLVEQTPTGRWRSC